MARADFYILNGNTTATRFSCSIANKAWSQGNKVYIIVRDADEASRIDNLLWTFHDISFLPHATVENALDDTPILIGWPGSVTPHANVIINLTDTIPDCITSFERIVEIVPEDPALRDRGRKHYKAYRDMGFEIFNHTINMEQ